MWYGLWCSVGFAWQIIGPQRGHVLDVDISREEMLVSTRVGVMRSDKYDIVWTRDDRFPPDTKVLSNWSNEDSSGAWASVPTQLWEIPAVGSTDSMRLVQSFSQSVITDLDARDDGVLFFGLRGKTKGLWRVEPNGVPKMVIPNVEPWVILAEDRNVWVGTIEHGLWASEQGQPFVQMTTGSVSAIEKVGDSVWFSVPSGEIYDVHSQQEIVKIQDGFASHIADIGNGDALLTIVSPSRKAHPFQVLHTSFFSDATVEAITKLQVDDDSGYIGFTGAWSMHDGSALVGSFRRGPLLWANNELRTEREGFYATVSAGAAMDAQGRVAMAFMGTGVYLYQDGKIVPHPTEGPVTDSVGVRSVLGEIVVVDFEGINILAEDGSWVQLEGLPDNTKRIRNSLRDVTKTDANTWWGIDHYGKLWKKYTEEKSWQPCISAQGIRFAGDGQDALVVTKTGFTKLLCDRVEYIHTQIENPADSKAWGNWVATAGALFYDGQPIAELPKAKVDSLVLDTQGLDEGVLVSLYQEKPLRCTKNGCTEIAPALQEPIIQMGRLLDGRVWVLEEKGSLLVDDGSEWVPPSWYEFTEHRVWYTSFMQLYVNPWMGMVNPQKAVFTVPPKQSWFWMVGAIIAICMGGVIVWFTKRRS